MSLKLFPFNFRLDPALIRPGRVDLKEYIGHCSKSQLQQMFRRFYPDEPEHRGMDFAEKVFGISERVSAAQIQGLFMFYKDDAQAVTDNVDQLKNL